MAVREAGVTSGIRCYAVAPPGVESVTARELAGLGLVPGATEPGGVAFQTDLDGLWTANLQLRTASRVIVRLAHFTARTFAELERHAARAPWSSVLAPDAAIRFRVTSRKSKLYHQRGIAERLLRAAAAHVAGVHVAGPETPTQEFVVRLFRDACTISADSSGDLLHLRGYRQAVARAPLRETLAASMLLAAGWDGSTPLVDPFCGSGTIPIEAALMARGIPPGWQRRFAFERWPGFDPARWTALRARAGERIRPRAPAPILGADRDAGAIEAARANAERAGVTDDVAFRHASVSALAPPVGTGWIITNPPYGIRIGEVRALRDLHARFGQVLKARLPGWRVALLSASRGLDVQLGLELVELFRTRNGGIPVRVLRADVPT